MGFFLSFFLITAQAWASTPAEFAHGSAWTRLLHYQKNIFGFESSEITGSRFFLSPEGAHDPLAEFNATLQALTLPLPEKQDPNEHAVCLYPARLKILIKEGFLRPETVPKLVCSSFEVYRTRIQTKKVNVVFSSYYLGSASSVFGHSFLRFSGDNENELFDTGINFSATPTTQNPVLYALFGLIGVFPSSFSAQPYYFKIREYNDFESRDLWTYELDLTSEERSFLLDHLWELGNTTFRYYYFNQNCSYHILRAVEAAAPRLTFFTRRPVYLIPSESIQLIGHPVSGQEHFVQNFSYRPSLRNVSYARFAGLNDHDKNLVLSLLHSQSVPSAETFENKAASLDTLMDAIDLNHAGDLVDPKSASSQWKQKVLMTRANVPGVSPTLNLSVPSEDNPALGHGERRLALSYGQSRQDTNNQPYFDLQARASHHDLLDPSVGYPENLHIDFGRIGFRYYSDSSRFLLQELTVVDLTALAVQHPLFSRWSYDALITYDHRAFADCSDAINCGAIRVRGGIGSAYAGFEHQTLFFLLNVEPQYGFHFQGSRFKFALSPSANSLFQFTRRLKGILGGSLAHTFFTQRSFATSENAELRYAPTDHWGAGIKMDLIQQSDWHDAEFALRGFYYF